MSDKKIMKTLNGYTVYDEDAHRRIDSLAGSAPGLVFDTVADMEAYVAEHSAELKVGQNLYIREVDVPDYWWDGTAAQELEVKVDLSGYAKQTEVDNLSEAIADKANKAGWTPDKYIGTDAEGNIIEKDAPTGGDGWTIDELTAETEIADDDTLPFYDTSAKGQRKTLWGNIKTVLKTYFDGEYLKLSGGILTGKIVLPTGNQNVGFTNSEDQKIFGYGTIDSVSHMRIGDVGKPLQLRGSGERPKYNNDTLVLKTELDAALSSYITDIDTLIGGDE